ncbi:MAG: mechanosensitive ion channel [Candidatus Altiarchaeales archaeon]|nr:mechanosensitive ion channel [Candidatus Altiarchaeales archaeon]MBD3416016.1 mechanosensitive ion channel [Candidatus Altiarchaeales archaeon]
MHRMKLVKMISLDMESRKNMFQDYLVKIERMQSKVIVVSFVIALFLGLILLSVRLELISIETSHLAMLSNIMLSIFAVIVATAFLKITTPLLNRFFFFLDSSSRSIVVHAWNYGVWFVALLAILARFTGHMQSLGISIGVFSAGLAIALQQPITSVVGWLIIMAKKPYREGDRIVVREIKGDVVEITLFYTVLREFGRDMDGDDPTGVKITIPNNIILMEPILNYTSEFPFIWDYTAVSVTYESDIQLARKLVKEASMEVLGDSMKRAVERMRPHLYGTPQEADLSEDPVVFTKFSDSSVVLDVRYICKAVRRRRVKSDINEKIIEAFGKHDNVTIAYPHQQLVFHDESIEGMMRKYLQKKS